MYSSGPMAEFELGDRYLNTILGFIGITQKQSIFVEGMNATPDKADDIKAIAISKAIEVAKKF